MNKDKHIRFIDSQHTTLFYLPNGQHVVFRYPDGTRQSVPCVYIDSQHVQVGYAIYHVHELAERMEWAGIRYAPKNPQPMPESCYAVQPATGELIHITRGKQGYELCPDSFPHREQNVREAAALNEIIHVTPQQEAAMLGGAQYGWHSPAARITSYDLYGKPLRRDLRRMLS